VIVLDTNVISELMSTQASPTVRRWIAQHRAVSPLCITAITVAEILYGIELLPRGKRRDSLLRDAEAMFREDIVHKPLAFDEQAAREFSTIAAVRRGRGRPISTLDAQIAAIALANGATLATRDTSGFEDCGVRLINPWD
jgi:predicted nucleic acid-binding protein